MANFNIRSMVGVKRCVRPMLIALFAIGVLMFSGCTANDDPNEVEGDYILFVDGFSGTFRAYVLPNLTEITKENYMNFTQDDCNAYGTAVNSSAVSLTWKNTPLNTSHHDVLIVSTSPVAARYSKNRPFANGQFTINWNEMTDLLAETPPGDGTIAAIFRDEYPGTLVGADVLYVDFVLGVNSISWTGEATGNIANVETRGGGTATINGGTTNTQWAYLYEEDTKIDLIYKMTISASVMGITVNNITKQFFLGQALCEAFVTQQSGNGGTGITGAYVEDMSNRYSAEGTITETETSGI